MLDVLSLLDELISLRLTVRSSRVLVAFHFRWLELLWLFLVAFNWYNTSHFHVTGPMTADLPSLKSKVSLLH